MQALPQPDQDSAAHSERCAAYLRDRIGSGSISFGEYMDLCLYAPGLGYYLSGNRKFGPGGDFVTAPEISPVFAGVVARQAACMLAQTSGGDVVEFGAGSGRLAVDLFARLDALGQRPERYRIVEVSPELAERQRRLVEESLPGHAASFEWLDRVPSGVRGVVIANEVLDALPVERFLIEDGQLLECRVVVDGDGFATRYEAASAMLEAAYLDIEKDLGQPLPDGYCSEICLAATGWVREIVDALAAGAIFLFDYGTDRRSYYAADRASGWLRCHFRHHAHNDALVFPGIQDITAWVDFTRVAQAAVDAGADIGGYVTQAHFLMHGGLDEEVARAAGAALERQLALTSAIKTLILPGEMGERVKCLGLLKGDVDAPSALTAMDMTRTL